MEIILATAELHDPVVHNLFDFYCYDFSEFTHEGFNGVGRYTAEDFLKAYWGRPDWRAYLLRVDNEWAGFAWIVQGTLFESNPPLAHLPHFVMDEFFIARKFRHRGLGDYLARYVFNLYAGAWEVTEIPKNTPAQKFWRRVIPRYTNGEFEEIEFISRTWGAQPMQVFDNTKLTKGQW